MVAHNAKFDLAIIEKEGIVPTRNIDTLRVAEPSTPRTSSPNTSCNSCATTSTSRSKPRRMTPWATCWCSSSSTSACSTSHERKQPSTKRLPSRK
ncbi:MAG: hypothetical protein WDN09_04160 [bacterium]